jgi:hypothetical protein
VNTLQGLKPRSFCRTLALTLTTLCDTDVTRPILQESSEPMLLLYDKTILLPNASAQPFKWRGLRRAKAFNGHDLATANNHLRPSTACFHAWRCGHGCG